MANGPLHKLCHSCPWGQIWPRPGGSIVSIDLLWEKNSKIFFSETTGPTAFIFGMWQWLMVLYINCASHAPGVKFGHAPGVDSLHRLTIGKTKKNFFSETKRPRASIFCLQCLVVPIINYASHAPGSNLAMPRGSIVSMHRLSLVDSQLI